MHVDKISMELPIMILGVTYIVAIKIVFIYANSEDANSEDPDDMLYYATFHLGLHCQSTH